MKENHQCCKQYVNTELTGKRTSVNDEGSAMQAAQQCLGSVTCDNCDLCIMFCPDLCITRNTRTNEIEIDYDYCKGCGICAFICPKNAIQMMREETD